MLYQAAFRMSVVAEVSCLDVRFKQASFKDVCRAVDSLRRGRVLRIVGVTDIHGNLAAVKKLASDSSAEADLIVISGDLTDRGGVDEAREVLAALKERWGSIMFVPGNMDLPLLAQVDKLEEAVNLHGKVIEYSGARIAGFGGGNKSPFHTPFELSENEISEGLSLLHGDIDILVTHAPPYGTRCDKAMRIKHVGSKSIRRFIEERKPKICLCGHIHESKCVDRVGESMVVNPGPLSWGNYAYIEYSDKVHIELRQVR